VVIHTPAVEPWSHQNMRNKFHIYGINVNLSAFTCSNEIKYHLWPWKKKSADSFDAYNFTKTFSVDTNAEKTK
jgi:hypothetical protein